MTLKVKANPLAVSAILKHPRGWNMECAWDVANRLLDWVQ